jgi:hypothetical protein
MCYDVLLGLFVWQGWRGTTAVGLNFHHCHCYYCLEGLEGGWHYLCLKNKDVSFVKHGLGIIRQKQHIGGFMPPHQVTLCGNMFCVSSVHYQDYGTDISLRQRLMFLWLKHNLCWILLKSAHGLGRYSDRETLLGDNPLYTKRGLANFILAYFIKGFQLWRAL